MLMFTFHYDLVLSLLCGHYDYKYMTWLFFTPIALTETLYILGCGGHVFTLHGRMWPLNNRFLSYEKPMDFLNHIDGHLMPFTLLFQFFKSAQKLPRNDLS